MEYGNIKLIWTNDFSKKKKKVWPFILADPSFGPWRQDAT